MAALMQKHVIKRLVAGQLGRQQQLRPQHAAQARRIERRALPHRQRLPAVLQTDPLHPRAIFARERAQLQPAEKRMAARRHAHGRNRRAQRPERRQPCGGVDRGPRRRGARGRRFRRCGPLRLRNLFRPHDRRGRFLFRALRGKIKSRRFGFFDIILKHRFDTADRPHRHIAHRHGKRQQQPQRNQQPRRVYRPAAHLFAAAAKQTDRADQRAARQACAQQMRKQKVHRSPSRCSSFARAMMAESSSSSSLESSCRSTMLQTSAETLPSKRRLSSVCVCSVQARSRLTCA